MEQLTPIDEEPAEDNDEDQPITMIPKIMHTAPSPTTDIPPQTATIQNELNSKHYNDNKPNNDVEKYKEYEDKENENEKEIGDEKENNGNQIISENKKNSSNDKDVNQIESVL